VSSILDLGSARRHRWWAWLLLLALSGEAGACSKKAHPPEPEPSLARLPPSRPYRFATPRRLVAIGDLHGDIAAARRALRLGGAVDDGGSWTGGHLVVVQIGDQLDRGDNDHEVLDYVDQLARQAAAAGGALHVLNGNHEMMNVAGDFRYVSKAGMKAFAELAPGSAAEMGRRQAFAPGGTYARKLAERNVVEIVGETAFVHGGLLPVHVRADVGRINETVRQWMLGVETRLPEIAGGPESPVWIRTLSEGTPAPRDCRELASTLAALGVRRLVVGHTVQPTGINSACGGLVWRIDVGLSDVYGQHPVQILEIMGDTVRPIVEGPRGTAIGADGRRRDQRLTSESILAEPHR
jgi:hypothetical protein